VKRGGDRTTGIDPETAQTVVLFDPRNEAWEEHFCWQATGSVRDFALSCLVGAEQPGPRARVIGEFRRPAVDLR
jgi:hypothetical protein